VSSSAIRKVVFLIQQPLDPRNFERFGIATWLDRHWNVEVWDLTPLAQPQAWRDFQHSGREISRFEGNFPIASRVDVRKRLASAQPIDYFIDLAGHDPHSMWAKRRLVRAGVRRVVLTGSIPLPDEAANPSLVSKVRSALARGPMEAARSLAGAVSRRSAQPFMAPDLLVASGQKSIPAVRPGQQVLRAHNLDFDLYLKLRESLGSAAGGYGVFLDQNLCFAPDYVYEKVPPYVTPQQYYPTLCKGFRSMAASLGVPIRISAHPRLPRTQAFLNYFEGLPLEYGRSAELIANCDFVVCHYTTAIQFAVLFRKPVLFVTTDELYASAGRKYVDYFAGVMGKPVINLNGNLDAIDWRAQLDTDFSRYDQYRREYIKTDGSPEKPFWQIVIDHMESVASPAAAGRVQ
jgi:hypothetical protein